MNISQKLMLPLAASALLLASCSKSNNFEVSGTINDAKDAKIYLVREGLDSIVVCDSAKVSATGRFSLESRRPLGPELYSLRLDSASLLLAVDSTEHITVNADKKLKDCEILGSEHSAQLYKWQKTTAQIADSVARVLVSTTNRETVNEQVFGLIKTYKDSASAAIRKDPASVVSYYLLFKPVVLGIQPFDVFAKEDFHDFAIVANMWNKENPNTPRAGYLKTLMEDMHRVRGAETFKKTTEGMARAGFVDLSFPNANRQNVSLSSLKGKNILLEFCYLAQMSDEANSALKKLHDQYKQKGFEIYMVTFDRNYEVWQKQAASLPWVVVLDVNESSAVTYNFKRVPTNYFIDKAGNIVGRDVTLSEVDEYLKNQ